MLVAGQAIFAEHDLALSAKPGNFHRVFRRGRGNVKGYLITGHIAQPVGIRLNEQRPRLRLLSARYQCEPNKWPCEALNGATC